MKMNQLRVNIVICTPEFAKEHHGLRAMKATIGAGSLKETQAVFHAIVKYVNELDENQYDNYLIQRKETTHCTFFSI